MFSILPKLGRRFLTGYEDRLSDIDLGSSLIIKTHSLPSGKHNNCKVVFIFGDPLDSVLSAKEMEKKFGQKWFEEHIFHLESNSNTNDWLEHDVLNFESQLETWQLADSALIIHYDDIWKYKNYISEFLGFELFLPTRKNRSKKQYSSLIDITLYKKLRNIETNVRQSQRYKSQFQ